MTYLPEPEPKHEPEPFSKFNNLNMNRLVYTILKSAHQNVKNIEFFMRDNFSIDQMV